MINIINKNYHNINKIDISEINTLTEYVVNKNNNKYIGNKKTEIEELFNLFDITSYISLFLFRLYIDDYPIKDNYKQLICENQKDYYDNMFVLYKLSLIFKEINKNSPEHKKLLIFSLFNIFSINFIPNIQIFKHYKEINVCLINHKSILFSESLVGTYLDIIHKDNYPLYSGPKKFIPFFDSEGNFSLLYNDNLYKLFMILLSKYINIFYEKNISNLTIPRDPFGNKPMDKTILYYYDIMN
jgi:hypothetical protein